METADAASMEPLNCAKELNLILDELSPLAAVHRGQLGNGVGKGARNILRVQGEGPEHDQRLSIECSQSRMRDARRFALGEGSSALTCSP